MTIDINFNSMQKSCCQANSPQGREIKQASSFIKLLNEPNRLRILCLLKQGELCVCEIFQALNLPQNLVSHHLKVLKDFGLISSRKEGLKVFYRLNQKTLASQTKLLTKFLKP
ncbi:metalloregulator ArsR/SmtB family transcription factor [Patescibacteria group bacterium]|nr:metalloregulator ArsR/SmtB family transcription factor [Patescibacteria group bacterium]